LIHQSIKEKKTNIMKFTFTTLKGKQFEMEQSLFQSLFDSGVGTKEERSHLMMQALDQLKK